ncbi:MAG: NADPH-dependent FMN reductase [Litorimonas sp.]
MSSAKIGFLCASLRVGSINKQLENALILRSKDLGVDTSIIDLAEFKLPLFHGDLQTPDNVKALINKMKSFDGIVITSPEYNGGLPPILKNAIDWTSTVGTDHFTSPIYGIASCAPGSMSGIMGMRQTAYILGRLGAEVIPTQVGCGKASQAFGKNGQLIAQPAADLANQMLTSLIERIARKVA